jgi:kinesin family protein 5
MSSTLHVSCRVRPDPNPIGVTLPTPSATAPDASTPATSLFLPATSHTFTFDQIFPPSAPQSQVYSSIGLPLLRSCFEGFNCTIFAYGQTSSGKTHTMQGSAVDPGLCPRIISAVFARISQSPPSTEFVVTTSYCEIYLEKIRDLLDPAKTNLAIREDPTMGIYVQDLTTQYVGHEAELLEVIAQGNVRRATSSTWMNSESSRSHSVLTITVLQRDVLTGTSVKSKVNLVDLAGSEAVKKSGAANVQLEEANAINSSLTALGKVIYALTDAAATHVPFRDSKLTRMLQESLGGNAQTWLVINVSPSPLNAPETLSTLRFGMRAKNVKTKAVVNQIRSNRELEELLAKAQARIREQDAQIQNLLLAAAAAASTGAAEPGGNRPAAADVATAAAAVAATAETSAKVADLERLAHSQREDVDRLSQDLLEARKGWEELQVQVAEHAAETEQHLNQISQLQDELVSASIVSQAAPAQQQQQQAPSQSEQRLEKLISVHRQLLRKYANMETEKKELEEKIRALQRLVPKSEPTSRIVRVLRGGNEPVMLL